MYCLSTSIKALHVDELSFRFSISLISVSKLFNRGTQSSINESFNLTSIADISARILKSERLEELENNLRILLSLKSADLYKLLILNPKPQTQ